MCEHIKRVGRRGERAIRLHRITRNRNGNTDHYLAQYIVVYGAGHRFVCGGEFASA